MKPKRKTHCHKGHRFTKKNTRVSASGRHCKTCDAERSARRYAETKDLGQYTRKQKVERPPPMHQRSEAEKLAHPEYGPLLQLVLEARNSPKRRSPPPRTYTRITGVFVGATPSLSRPEAP